MDLSNVTNKELITELSKRKGIEYIDAGIYEQWKLVGKYDKRNIQLPNKYKIILITNSAEIGKD